MSMPCIPSMVSSMITKTQSFRGGPWHHDSIAQMCSRRMPPMPLESLGATNIAMAEWNILMQPTKGGWWRGGLVRADSEWSCLKRKVPISLERNGMLSSTESANAVFAWLQASRACQLMSAEEQANLDSPRVSASLTSECASPGRSTTIPAWGSSSILSSSSLSAKKG